MTLYVEQSSASSPGGYRTLALSYLSVLLVVFVVPEASTTKVSSTLCVLITLLAIYNKLRLRPSSVFLLAVAGVILNTYAVGYGMPFKYAVVISPLISMTQAFLTLPFAVKELQTNE